MCAIEAVEPPVDVPGREDLGQHDGRAQHQVHGGEDDRERALALGFAPGLAIAREDGDEGDGGRAADQKVRDHVGQHKGGVEASACTPLPKSHMMYLTRTRPMMRDRKADTMSTTVARRRCARARGAAARRPRAHRDFGCWARLS